MNNLKKTIQKQTKQTNKKIEKNTINALQIENVSKKFITNKKEKIILNNISFDIKQGDIFGLVGLNGIGKTTLIKIILDMLKSENGKISLYGTDNKKAISRQNVCYLPEKFLPSPYLTGYEFLKISLSFYKKDFDEKNKEQIEKVNKIAENIDLDKNVLPNVISKYSKGMGQKLGLLSCFLSNAKLLILDEPMTGLDPKSRIALKQTIKNYSKQGNSIFFSSHILEDVNEICNKIAVLNNGEIKFFGKPNYFIKKYSNRKNNNFEKAFLECIKN